MHAPDCDPDYLIRGDWPDAAPPGCAARKRVYSEAMGDDDGYAELEREVRKFIVAKEGNEEQAPPPGPTENEAARPCLPRQSALFLNMPDGGCERSTWGSAVSAVHNYFSSDTLPAPIHDTFLLRFRRVLTAITVELVPFTGNHSTAEGVVEMRPRIMLEMWLAWCGDVTSIAVGGRRGNAAGDAYPFAVHSTMKECQPCDFVHDMRTLQQAITDSKLDQRVNIATLLGDEDANNIGLMFDLIIDPGSRSREEVARTRGTVSMYFIFVLLASASVLGDAVGFPARRAGASARTAEGRICVLRDHRAHCGLRMLRFLHYTVKTILPHVERLHREAREAGRANVLLGGYKAALNAFVCTVRPMLAVCPGG